MKKKQSNRRGAKRIRGIINRFVDSQSQAPGAVDTTIPLTKQWSIEEQEAILEYLHGDTPSDEVKACCYYEYARASQKAWRAIHPANADDFPYEISANFPVHDLRTLAILVCPGYPEWPWRELDKAVREEILPHFAKGLTPLITDARTLKLKGILDRLNKQAADYLGAVLKCKKRMIPLGQCPAVVGDDAIKHVVITINYSEGIDVVKEVISSWLAGEENRKRFRKYYKKPIKGNPDSPQRYKTLLKLLAAWRLYDELGFGKAAEWTKDNRRQQAEQFAHRAFFAEKAKSIVRGEKLFFGPLYKEQRDWQRARTDAQSFLRTEIEVG